MNLSLQVSSRGPTTHEAKTARLGMPHPVATATIVLTLPFLVWRSFQNLCAD